MDKSYLKGDICFSFSFNLSYIDEMEDKERRSKTLEWETNCVYSAIIKDVNGEISIQLIDTNKEGNKISISFMSRQWNDYIPYFEFGKYVEIHEAHINNVPIVLDLSSTCLKEIVSSHDCYCCLHIDRYQYSYAQVNEKSSITYYLYETSKNLISDLLNPQFSTEYVEPKKLTLGKNVSCVVSINNESDLYPIRIEFDDSHFLQNEIEKEFGLLCDIISFYYAIPIECGASLVYEKNQVKVYREKSHYNACKKIIRNWNLCYLNYGISHDLTKFLTTIYENRTDLEDKLGLLHTTINDYVRSFNLDEESRFLILYSILETYSKKIKQSCPIENTEFHAKMELVFNDLYSDFIKKMDVNDDINYKKIWERAKDAFSAKEPHSIVKLFRQYDIDNEKINKEIQKTNIKSGKHKIRNISDLRNQLVHNRNEDNIYKLPMDMINSKLSFAVCIILLYNLGFRQIEFYKDWSLLSILKEKSNDCLTND